VAKARPKAQIDTFLTQPDRVILGLALTQEA
jgi:hypothetical protein